jgi:hypothetical protein
MLAWADSHLDTLKASVQGFLANNPYELVTKHDKETGDQSVCVRVIRPTPEDWVFRIGDALHDMRVPLDYLAFAIAERHAPTFAAAKPRKILFPICDDIKDWPSFEGRIRQWASPAAIQALEGLQPYHGRNAPQPELLFLLDALENPHKHRRLLAAGSAVIKNSFSIVHDPTGSINIMIISIRGGPFEDGTEMMRYRLRRPPHPKAKVNFDVAFGVAFAQQGPAAGAGVIKTLEDIRDHVRDVVFPALEPFI